MNFICKHCNSNLDKGDVFEYFLAQNGILSEEQGNECYEKAKENAKMCATMYGWSENNKVHFTREVILQQNKGSQHTICPDCKNSNPLS